MTEDLIPLQAIYERFHDRSWGRPGLDADILRWQGLSPARYRLEPVEHLSAMRIVRKETP